VVCLPLKSSSVWGLLGEPPRGVSWWPAVPPIRGRHWAISAGWGGNHRGNVLFGFFQTLLSRATESLAFVSVSDTIEGVAPPGGEGVASAAAGTPSKDAEQKPLAAAAFGAAALAPGAARPGNWPEET